MFSLKFKLKYMSRSFKKTPIHGNAVAESEKSDKIRANRDFRRAVQAALYHEKEIPLFREVSDVWDFAKDGKHYGGNSARESYPKCFRK
jgi:hypothetical protein